MNKREAVNLSIRYFILVLLGLFQLKILYFIFTPLTIYPFYWIISLFYENAVLLEGDTIFFSGLSAEIIPACVGGAAYYLLLILNLSTPMKIKKRAKSLFFLLGSFLVLNIMRMLVFAALLVSGFSYFDLSHRLMWYFGSTIMVVILWFANVYLFKIKDIPIYSDFKNLFKSF